MSGGVEALRAAFAADTALTTLVPAARIIGDDALPTDIVYPAITLASISGIDLLVIAPGAYQHVRERVQATIYAANRPSRKAVLAAVRKAGAYKRPTVSGIDNITIHTGGAGQDFTSQGDVRITTQDFIVRYNEPL